MGCIAQYTEDDLYYRARVDDVNEEEGVAIVLFVDYGTKETVPVERYSFHLLPENAAFIELSD